MNPLTLDQLGRKRAEVVKLIATRSLLTSASSAVPTPVIEVFKQAGIATADVVMCWKVYRIYFDDTPATHFLDVLRARGLLSVGGTVATYSLFKLSEGLAAEFLNAIPGAGWIVSGLLTFSVTVTVGGAFALLCDAHYRGVAVEAAFGAEASGAEQGATALAPSR